MNRKSFIDKIDDETMARMIDTTYKYEKRRKTGVRADALKLAVMVAAVLLVISLANITGIFSMINEPDNTPGAAVIRETEIETEARGTEIEEAIEIIKENLEELIADISDRIEREGIDAINRTLENKSDDDVWGVVGVESDVDASDYVNDIETSRWQITEELIALIQEREAIREEIIALIQERDAMREEID